MRFLLVEDNVELARLLTAGLVAQGLAADVVETAADARLALGSIRYSAMILDLGLPDEDGMNVLKELRRDRDPLPVLVLTARGSVDDRVQGLRAGADDYLVKPFALEELVARLQALMRRPGELLGRSLSIANLVFDTESRQIFVDGRPELFSARESAVLELLMRRQGRVVTKKAVEDQIFERGFRVQREFTADAAHELRTPLAILRARLETLADTTLLHELHDDIDSMSRIINQLLEVAELDVAVVAQSEQTDLTSVGSDVVQAMAPLALRQNRSVALTGAAEPVWVKGNAEMIRRAIRNLVENALHHTPPGTTVEVNVDGNGGVRVSDEGPGVPLSERELIFRRFWRRDRRRTGGAGLGLAIVRRIVDAHGGSIAVTDGETGGATFSVRLRLARVADRRTTRSLPETMTSGHAASDRFPARR